MISIAILGSTGSIGTMSLDVIRRFPDHFRVDSLAARGNVDLFARQILEFKPRLVALSTPEAARRLRKMLDGLPITILEGEDGLSSISTSPTADVIIAAIAGAAGLKPTWHAVAAGKKVALANKESLVMGGKLLMALAKERGAAIIPVDSEHSAIFQCLQGNRREDLATIILTASGGPFQDLPAEKLAKVTPEQALNHPVWSMGQKVTIDSATLMNKGLEVIEARWLFDVPAKQIEVVIHPQSIVHSMVRYKDGSVISHMSKPDMRIPILFALTHPQRWAANLPELDLFDTGQLTFARPDTSRFPCLKLAFDALQRSDAAPIVLNRADEIAVAAFLQEQIPFTGIPAIIGAVLDRFDDEPLQTLHDIDRIDRWARETAQACLHDFSTGISHDHS